MHKDESYYHQIQPVHNAWLESSPILSILPVFFLIEYRIPNAFLTLSLVLRGSDLASCLGLIPDVSLVLVGTILVLLLLECPAQECSCCRLVGPVQIFLRFTHAYIGLCMIGTEGVLHNHWYINIKLEPILKILLWVIDI